MSERRTTTWVHLKFDGVKEKRRQVRQTKNQGSVEWLVSMILARIRGSVNWAVTLWKKDGRIHDEAYIPKVHPR